MIICPLAGIPGVDYRITQGFDERPEVYKQFGLHGHNGFDLAPAVAGTPGVTVYAPHDGMAYQYNELDTGFGKYVEIVFTSALLGGRKSVLAHLQDFLVKKFQVVRQGDPIGIMGSTGFSSGIHLHWGYKKLNTAGVTIDRNNGWKGAIDVSQYVILPAKGKQKPFAVLKDFRP